VCFKDEVLQMSSTELKGGFHPLEAETSGVVINERVRKLPLHCLKPSSKPAMTRFDFKSKQDRILSPLNRQLASLGKPLEPSDCV